MRKKNNMQAASVPHISIRTFNTHWKGRRAAEALYNNTAVDSNATSATPPRRRPTPYARAIATRRIL